MKSLQILFVAHQFPPESTGGVEIHTLHLARAMAERGHRVQVLYPGHDDSLPEGTLHQGEYMGIRTSALNLRSHSDLLLDFKNDSAAALFRRHMEASEADVIHFQHLIGFSASVLPVCHELGIPTALTVHDAWLFCQQGHLIDRTAGSAKRGLKRLINAFTA
jgi:glycosyltransferase involved in cell wall biosynthesis